VLLAYLPAASSATMRRWPSNSHTVDRTGRQSGTSAPPADVHRPPFPAGNVQAKDVDVLLLCRESPSSGRCPAAKRPSTDFCGVGYRPETPSRSSPFLAAEVVVACRQQLGRGLQRRSRHA
jgi:hypothetical protein